MQFGEPTRKLVIAAVRMSSRAASKRVAGQIRHKAAMSTALTIRPKIHPNNKSLKIRFLPYRVSSVTQTDRLTLLAAR